MKIFIVGTTGRVGEKLVSRLVTEGHTIYAGARNTDKVTLNDHIKPVHFYLHWSAEKMSETIRECQVDAIYFVAGSRGKDLIQSDLFGAVKVMQAAELASVKRFIHLSSMSALEPNKWTSDAMKSLADYYVTKYFSDNWLINNTALDYTILQPGALTEDIATGLVDLQITESKANSITDVADTLAELINHNQTIKQVISMSQGTTPIREAIEQL